MKKAGCAMGGKGALAMGKKGRRRVVPARCAGLTNAISGVGRRLTTLRSQRTCLRYEARADQRPPERTIEESPPSERSGHLGNAHRLNRSGTGPSIRGRGKRCPATAVQNEIEKPCALFCVTAF